MTKHSFSVVEYLRSADEGVRDQNPTGCLLPPSCLCDNAQPSRASDASLLREYGKPSRSNRSTGENIRHVFKVSKTDLRSSSCSVSILGSPFLTMEFKGTAILAKWSRNVGTSYTFPETSEARSGFVAAFHRLMPKHTSGGRRVPRVE